MNQFSIRDIENLCGIKAHTIRIWEQRYQLCVARRKQSQHRIYTNDDLKELLRVSYLYHNGHKISRIAELGKEEIHRLVECACNAEGNQSVYIHQLIEAGIDLDKEKFEKLANCIVMRLGLERSLREVFYPFLEKIGMLWITNHVIPAQEHFVSHIIRKKVILATDGLQTDPRRPANILLFAPEGEHHEIPLLVANYFFIKNNRRTIYFGTNVAAQTLRHYLADHPVDYLYAHVVTNLCGEGLEKYVYSLCKEYPDKKFILSGPACECLDRKLPNLQRVNSFEEMATLAERVNLG